MTVGVQEFWSFILVFARVTALMVSAPVFSNRAAPRQVKVGLAALFALAIRPLVFSAAPPPPAHLFGLVGALAAETAVGLCMGFLVTLLFAALEVGGHFLDVQMGFGIINVLNPLSEHQSSALGQWLYQLGITLFLVGGGHILLLANVAQSFQVVPPGGAHFSGDLTYTFVGVAGQMLLIAFKIAAPAAAVLLIVDIAFGIIARTMPQMNVFVVGLPAKVVLGLTTVSLALPVVALVVGEHLLPGMSDATRQALRAAR